MRAGREVTDDDSAKRVEVIDSLLGHVKHVDVKHVCGGGGVDGVLKLDLPAEANLRNFEAHGARCRQQDYDG